MMNLNLHFFILRFFLKLKLIYFLFQLLNRSDFGLNKLTIVFRLLSCLFLFDCLSSLLDFLVFSPNIGLHFPQPKSSENKANSGVLHEVLARWALFLLYRDHRFDHFVKLIWELLRDPFNLAQFYLVSQLNFIRCFEGGSQAYDFVQNAPCWPNVWFVVVGELRNLLGRHVVRCSNVGVSKLRFVTHYPWKAEVAQFHIALRVDEHVSRF